MTDKQPATVEVDLAGETITLTASLSAATAISRQYGGLRKAFEHVSQGDIDTIAFVFAAGTEKQDARALKDLTNQVYEAGVLVMAAPASRFLGILLGGGQAAGS